MLPSDLMPLEHLVQQALDLIEEGPDVDFGTLRADHPELFSGLSAEQVGEVRDGFDRRRKTLDEFWEGVFNGVWHTPAEFENQHPSALEGLSDAARLDLIARMDQKAEEILLMRDFSSPDPAKEDGLRPWKEGQVIRSKSEKFILREWLGRGGEGAVWLATTACGPSPPT